MIVRYKYRLTNEGKYSTLVGRVDDKEAYEHVETGVVWEILAFIMFLRTLSCSENS